MRAYSLDLRECFIDVIKSGEYSQAKASELFHVSLSFVEKVWHLHRTSGDIAHKPYTPGPQCVLAPYGTWIRAAIDEQPHITLAELCEQLDEERGTCVHPSMRWRELERL